MYTAAVRTTKGAWQHRTHGTTAREARRNLAQKAGLPVRVADKLPLGRSRLAVGQWAEAEVRG